METFTILTYCYFDVCLAFQPFYNTKILGSKSTHFFVLSSITEYLLQFLSLTRTRPEHAGGTRQPKLKKRFRSFQKNQNIHAELQNVSPCFEASLSTANPTRKCRTERSLCRLRGASKSIKGSGTRSLKLRSKWKPTTNSS